MGIDNAEIVWQWSFWDHMIQDYDPNKANYGVVAEHPELLDVNFIDSVGGASGGRDWLHCNGIDYNAHLDQIAISCKNTNEIYIIDHSTTTEELRVTQEVIVVKEVTFCIVMAIQKVTKEALLTTKCCLLSMMCNGFLLVILMKVV